MICWNIALLCESRPPSSPIYVHPRNVHECLREIYKVQKTCLTETEYSRGYMAFQDVISEREKPAKIQQQIQVTIQTEKINNWYRCNISNH